MQYPSLSGTGLAPIFYIFLSLNRFLRNVAFASVKRVVVWLILSLLPIQAFAQAPTTYPSNFQVPESSRKGYSFQVTWDPLPDGPYYYKVEEVGFATSTFTGNSGIVASGKQGTVEYRIRACKNYNSDCGPYSPSQFVVNYDQPGLVHPVTASTNSTWVGTSVPFSWSAPSHMLPESVYRIEVYAASNTLVDTFTTQSTNFNVPIYHNGILSIRVVACTFGLCGSGSSVAITSLAPALNYPDVVTVASELPINNDYQITWTHRNNVGPYHFVYENEKLIYSERAGLTYSLTRNHSTPGQYNYYTKACATERGNYCSPHSPITSTTLYDIPSAPGSLSVDKSEVAFGQNLTFSWQSPGGIVTLYELYAILTNGHLQFIGNTTDTQLTTSANYAGALKYQIRACNNSGCGNLSDFVPVNVVPLPTAPTNLQIPDVLADQQHAFLNWTAASGHITRYEIFENGNIKGSSQTTKYYTFFQGHRYVDLSVRACNELACGPLSTNKRIFVYSTPGPVNNVTLDEAYLGGTINLTWTAASNEMDSTFYQVDRYLDDTSLGTIRVSDRQYSEISQEPGSYVFYVRACNFELCSAPLGKTLTIKVPLMHYPDVPTVAPHNPVNTDYQITWTSKYSAGSYTRVLENDLEVYFGYWNDTFSITRKHSSPGQYRYTTQTCLSTRRKYCSEESWESITQVYGVANVPTTLASDVATVRKNTSVNFNWAAPENLVPGGYYEVFAETAGVNVNVLTGLNEPNAAYSFAEHGEYQIRVRACQPMNVGCSAYSSPITIIVQPDEPGPVSQLTVPRKENVDQPVSINWQPGEGVITSYKLFANQRIIYSGSATQYSHLFDTPGQYDIYIQACNETGCSDNSDTTILQVYRVAQATDKQVEINEVYGMCHADIVYVADVRCNTTVTLVPTDVDPALAPVTLVSVSAPSGAGSLIQTAQGVLYLPTTTDPATGAVSPHNTFKSGSDSFSYTLKDATGSESTATVQISVNRAPISAPGTIVLPRTDSCNENQVDGQSCFVIANIPGIGDPDGDPYSNLNLSHPVVWHSWVDTAENGVYFMTPNRDFRYEPTACAYGASLPSCNSHLTTGDRFEYRLIDSKGAVSAPATIDVIVIGTPSKATNLQLSSSQVQQNAEILMTWNSAPDGPATTYFNVYIARRADPESPLALNLQANELTLPSDQLGNVTIRITACNDAGCSQSSQISYEVIPDIGLKWSKTEVTVGEEVILSWDTAKVASCEMVTNAEISISLTKRAESYAARFFTPSSNQETSWDCSMPNGQTLPPVSLMIAVDKLSSPRNLKASQTN